MSVMAVICNVNAATIVPVGDLYYSLSGIYASVHSVNNVNSIDVLEIPSYITYEGEAYCVNAISDEAFEQNKNITKIILPSTIQTIGRYAFAHSKIRSVILSEGLISIGHAAFYDTKITKIIIPSTVTSFEGKIYTNPTYDTTGTFEKCDLLREIIYLGSNAPTNWTATSHTYVPNSEYSSPYYSINNASVTEMITFSDNYFYYTGEVPALIWTNNVEGYGVDLTIPPLAAVVGNYNEVLTATFTKENESFTAQIPLKYVISKVTIKVTVNDANRLYGDPNPEITYSYTGFVNGEDESVISVKPVAETTATNISDVGTYPIEFVYGGQAQNYKFKYENGNLTVEKAPLDILVNDSEKIYGSENPNYTLGYTGLKNGETVPVWVTNPEFSTIATKESNVGSYEVNVSCEPKNYSIATNTPGTLTVKKAPLTIGVSDASMEYCGATPAFTYTYSGFVNGDDETTLSTLPSINAMSIVTSEVGNYTITPEGANANNYNISYNSGTLTITPRQLLAKAKDASRSYGEANPEFSITYTGFVNGESEEDLSAIPSVSTTATKTSDVGTYPIVVSGGSAKNYTFEYEQGELTVNKASLSIQVIDASKVYGAENPEFTLGYSGLKNNETVPSWITSPQFITDATKGSDVGTYAVSVECEPKNYSITANNAGTLTISQAPLTIKANNATMQYCGGMPDYTYGYSGFVNGDDATVLTNKPTIATEATATSNAGTYDIIPTGATAKNYEIGYESGFLEITKRDLTVTVNAATKVYGESNPEFTLSYSGFVNNENKNVLDTEPTASTAANQNSNAGSYDINVSGGKAKNYTFTYQSGQLTISPKDLKVSVGNYERAYGEDNPEFSIVYEGFAGNDTEDSLNPKPIVRTTATKTSNVGTYDLEVTGGYSPNYILSYDKGILTVNKAEQNFEWEQDLNNLEVGAQVELLAKASSGLPVTYIMDENDCAEIYKAGKKTYMECKSAGSFAIKAVQEGNENYYSTQRVTKTATIFGVNNDDPILTIKQADNGSISTKVKKGSKYTFTIHVEEGWTIHAITFNDEDVTNQLDEQNTFTTPAINENTSLIIVYEMVGESKVDEVKESSIRIQGTSFGVRVIDPNMGDLIQVFTSDGVLQKTANVENEITEILLPNNKVYVIKVGTKTVKLSL